MAGSLADDFIRAATDALPSDEAELLEALHAFTSERLTAARACRQRFLASPDDPAELHAFLRECWETIDGLAREVNLCMHHVFPDAGLYPPFEMSRQCTFYVLRQKLHACEQTAGHPVAELLWQQTREAPAREYARLSFLYNLSLFFPLPIPARGKLPGTQDVPDCALRIIRHQQIERCDADSGLNAILRWLKGLLAECYTRLAETVRATR